jgi:hypothetical protein
MAPAASAQHALARCPKRLCHTRTQALIAWCCGEGLRVGTPRCCSTVIARVPASQTQHHRTSLSSTHWGRCHPSEPQDQCVTHRRAGLPKRRLCLPSGTRRPRTPCPRRRPVAWPPAPGSWCVENPWRQCTAHRTSQSFQQAISTIIPTRLARQIERSGASCWQSWQSVPEACL